MKQYFWLFFIIAFLITQKICLADKTVYFAKVVDTQGGEFVISDVEILPDGTKIEMKRGASSSVIDFNKIQKIEATGKPGEPESGYLLVSVSLVSGNSLKGFLKTSTYTNAYGLYGTETLTGSSLHTALRDIKSITFFHDGTYKVCPFCETKFYNSTLNTCPFDKEKLSPPKSVSNTQK
ncbi:hypothetical protein ACFL47_05020 [Candidatus Latescibacterota bacterium]